MCGVCTPALITNPFETDAFVLIEPSALKTLNQFRQDTALKPESGGIILGYRRGPHLHIVEVTRPMPNDRQSRFSFDRAAQGHSEFALRRWRESNQVMDYLGEWHSHPEPLPAPSSIDLQGWRAILASRGKPMVFIIVGNDTSNWYGVGCSEQVRQIRF
jgi:integrative and conjugative element protein (TIGR02256 family)